MAGVRPLASSPPLRRIPDVASALALFSGLVGEPVEVAAFAYLDPEWRLLGMRHSRSALADTILIPIRDVAADALAFNAAGVVMAHNHPSGTPALSAADLAATRRLARGLEALDVRLHDHLVLWKDSCTSFRALGLL